jgi:hypothetical protein
MRIVVIAAATVSLVTGSAWAVGAAGHTRIHKHFARWHHRYAAREHDGKPKCPDANG